MHLMPICKIHTQLICKPWTAEWRYKCLGIEGLSSSCEPCRKSLISRPVPETIAVPVAFCWCLRAMCCPLVFRDEVLDVKAWDTQSLKQKEWINQCWTLLMSHFFCIYNYWLIQVALICNDHDTKCSVLTGIETNFLFKGGIHLTWLTIHFYRLGLHITGTCI